MRTGHVEYWVRGVPVNTPMPDRGVGTPVCTMCEERVDTGISFHGNGALCMSCISELRQELWERISLVATRRQPKGDPDG